MKIEAQIHGKKKIIDVPNIGSVITPKKKIMSDKNDPLPAGQSGLIIGYENNGIEVVTKIRYLSYNYYIPVRELYSYV